MKKRSLALAAAALATVTLLAACGSSSSESTLDKVKADGTITFGTEGTYPPFSYHDAKSHELTGYDVDVATAVAKKLGVKVKFAETVFDSIFTGLTSGRFDGVANQITITPERSKLYSFSDPYTVSSGVVVVKADNTTIKSVADLKGLTTAQSATTTFAKSAEAAGAKLEAVEGFAQAITLVKQGRVDATINDSLAVLQYFKTTNDTGVKIAAEAGGDVSRQAFAFRKGDTTLTAAVNKALADLQADGTLAKISDKYFGKDVSK